MATVTRIDFPKSRPGRVVLSDGGPAEYSDSMKALKKSAERQAEALHDADICLGAALTAVETAVRWLDEWSSASGGPSHPAATFAKDAKRRIVQAISVTQCHPRKDGA